MKRVIVLVLMSFAFLSTFALAQEEETIIPTPTQVPKKMNGKAAPEKPVGAIEFDDVCKPPSGRAIKKGQKGYEACLNYKVKNPNAKALENKNPIIKGPDTTNEKGNKNGTN